MSVQRCRATRRGNSAALLPAVLLAVGVAGSGCSSDTKYAKPYLAGPLASTASLASLKVTPTKDTIPVGGTVQLKATAYASGGVVVPTATFVWASVKPSVATVDANGLVTGVSPGSTSIKVTSDGLTVYSTTVVTTGTAPAPPPPPTAPTVASVAVSPTTVSATVGTQVQLVATVRDSAGNLLTGEPVAWSSNAPSVATVDTAGVVSSVAAGSVTITAASGGKQGQAAVTGVAPPTGTAQGSVVVNLGSPEQTMTGWEATAQAGQGTAAFPTYRDALWTQAADLGITRLRVAVRAGVENPTDWWTQKNTGQISESTFKCYGYTVVNDDSDPNHINAAGFHFSELDSTMEEVVLPYRAKLSSLGQKLYINANYTAFTGTCGNVAATHQNPQEYAEFALATFQHLQQKYGVVPDSWEMILEPDNGTPLNTGTLIGQALAATAAKLAAAGFHPAFVAPSVKTAANAPSWFDQIQAVAGAAGKVSELSYHRYGTAPTISVLDAIGQRTKSYGIRSSMLEKIGAGYNELIDDLLHARVSSWQEFTLAFASSTDGGGTYFIVSPTSPTFTMASRAKYLRQFFHYVLPGAARVAASTSQGGITPVAFQNASGKAVVVVRAGAAASFTVQGLPAGTYGVRYTTSTAADVAASADQTIAAGQLVKGSIPAAGVVTVFAR